MHPLGRPMPPSVPGLVQLLGARWPECGRWENMHVTGSHLGMTWEKLINGDIASARSQKSHPLSIRTLSNVVGHFPQQELRG